jgi:hypothetical protein
MAFPPSLRRIERPVTNSTRRANHFRSSEIVSSPQSKNILLSISANQNYKPTHPGPHEGRFAIVTKRRAGDVMDVSASGAPSCALDETPERTAKSCGPDTRCWCQVCGRFPAADGDKTNSLTGESTKYAVKPLRRGCRSVLRCPVCSCAPMCSFLAHEIAGAARTRHSLRPLFSRRDNEFGIARAKSCREIASTRHRPACRLRESPAKPLDSPTGIPETPVVEPIGCGVLGTPLSRGTTDYQFPC